MLHVLTYRMFDMLFVDTFVALFATYTSSTSSRASCGASSQRRTSPPRR